MQLTKYPQSCITLAGDGGRLLIDPGTIGTAAGYGVEELGDVDAVLYTHRHADHCDPELVPQLRDRGVALYGNADLAAFLGEGVEVVGDGETFEVAGFEVTARDLPHVVMVNGDPGPPNTGYVVDGTFFHPGDGIALPGLRVRDLALPIAGPSISFHDAYELVRSTGAQRVVPIHYDAFVAEPEQFARYCDLAEVIVLQPGGSTVW